jgi:hypothetical protein
LLQDRRQAPGPHRGFNLIGERARYPDAGFRRRDCRVGAVDGQPRFQPHRFAARVEAPIVNYTHALKCDDVVTGKFVGHFRNTALFQIGGACDHDAAHFR